MMNVQQLRAARAMLGLKQDELARKAGLSISTLNNIERGVQTDPKISTLRSLQQAFEKEGIEFTGDETTLIGLHYRKPSVKSKSAATILIIDDSPAIQKLYGAWLAKAGGYIIHVAGDALAGYAAFLQHKPSVIILDLHMYGMNGFQLLVKLKNENRAIPPIVFVSADINPNIKKQALDHGARCFLAKSTLTREEFCDAVAKAVV